jgi:hypothetical protein
MLNIKWDKLFLTIISASYSASSVVIIMTFSSPRNSIFGTISLFCITCNSTTFFKPSTSFWSPVADMPPITYLCRNSFIVPFDKSNTISVSNFSILITSIEGATDFSYPFVMGFAYSKIAANFSYSPALIVASSISTTTVSFPGYGAMSFT